ncbi:phage protease [Rhodoblastus sp.]|uniref:phage protease n=1 Tax=Rhodoblastus sp. TaxID=1962975 RepID=UPI003F99999E
MSRANATLFFALNGETGHPGFGAWLALNLEGDAPEWIALIPRGPKVRGFDGREWTLPDPQKLVSAFNARGQARPIDINHAEFLKAPRGEPSPAAGWIEELQIRDGEIFGRVSWTESGGKALQAREYRFISPAFKHDSKGHVVELLGAGLVNSPNLKLPALNSEESKPMFKNLLKKLGLAETANENDALAAVDALMTANNSRVDLAAFVPRADHQLALNRAQTAEAALSARDKAAHDAEVSGAIEAAIKSGKIAPASKDFYLATCASAEGFDLFKKHVDGLPTLFGRTELGTEGKDGKAPALNAQELESIKLMGLTTEQYLAAKA